MITLLLKYFGCVCLQETNKCAPHFILYNFAYNMINEGFFC